MATLEITLENFRDTIDNNPMVVIDFWAPWCGPCRVFGPVFEAASEKHPGIVFAKVNTEEQQDLAGAFNIRSIPTLMMFRDKIIIYSEAGALQGPQLDYLIGQAQELDMDEVRAEIARSQGEAAS